MKQIIQCPNCARQMTVDSKFAGRKLDCPICGKEMEIPNFEREETNREETPLETSAQRATEPSQPPREVETSMSEIGADADSKTGDTLLDPVRLEFPTVDRDDPMLNFFPDFQPNPFAVSYPLNVKLEDESDGANDEEEPFVNSKMPSVDELIN